MLSHIRNSHLRTLSSTMTAAAVAVIVGQLCATWLNLCGTSPDSIAALALGFAAGVIAVHWISSHFLRHSTDRRPGHVAAFLLALTLIALSWLTPTLLDTTLLAGCETISSTWQVAPILTMLFPALVVALVTAAAGLFFSTACVQPGRPWINIALAGAPGVAVLLLPVSVGMSTFPLAGSATLMVGMALVLCQNLKLGLSVIPAQAGIQIAALDSRLRGNDGSRKSRFDRALATQILKRTTDQISDHMSIFNDPVETVIGTRNRYAAALPFAAVGILIVAITETLIRLMPGSLPVLIQSVCITAMALVVLSRPLTMKLFPAPAMQVLALLTLALLPVLFGPLADLNLAINTGSLSAFSVLLLRSVQCAVFATATFVPVLCMSGNTPRAFLSRPTVLPFVVGVVSALTAVSQAISPLVLLAVGIVIHAVVQTIQISVQNHAWSATATRLSIARSCALPALSLLSTVLVGFGSVDTSRTSSLLFSERTTAALQHGVAPELIAQSHANRLVATVPSSIGEVTVWQQSGNVLEFQRNGMPVGRISTDTNVSPQPIEDILPAILPLASHGQTARVLLLGDDTGVCLRICTHFPVQEIVAVRTDRRITELAQRFTWSRQQLPPDQDARVHILHEPAMLALRRRELNRFDVVISSGENASLPSAACQFTAEFYQAARSRMTPDAIFCQRFRQSDPEPETLKAAMATMMTAFTNVGVIQTIPGELLLLASDADKRLINPELLSRLQRDHVRREIATAGWDWAQVAILPLLDARDPIGIFSHESLPPAISGSNCGLAMSLPFRSVSRADKQSELHTAFGPHQQQLLAAVPGAEDHEEVKRRLSALAQQLEILAGMPDQPWTYRKSLQMEMKQSPRPPRDLVESGRITKVAHPLDVLRQRYFVSLGQALAAASRGEWNPALISRLNTFTENFEPLITNFAHYEIVRLHELSQHPSPVDEFRHRLHIVFFTSSVDASVRPVIFALQQLVDQPSLIADDVERYDMLNSLLQKMIERWEARTAWEPRSAVRVQNDVDLSVGVANRAMAQMENLCITATVGKSEFYLRRRFVNAALIKPLRDYRDQVLAHRMKSETPVEQNTEDPNDLPLLINSGNGLNTN